MLVVFQQENVNLHDFLSKDHASAWSMSKEPCKFTGFPFAGAMLVVYERGTM